MSWQHRQSLPWQEPLVFTAHYNGQDIALLYSGRSERFTGSVSYLFLNPLETIEATQWHELPPLSEGDSSLPLWIGYLGYSMGDDAPHAPNTIVFPPSRFTRYAHLFRFDHQQQVLDWFSMGDASYPTLPTPPESTTTAITSITSNFTRSEYESVIRATTERIHAGDFYQANITRKFSGEFSAAPDSWQLFQNLCTASPAPYSAYIHYSGRAILSSSPECFLSVDASGNIITRPIKGSARRGADAAEDAQIQAALLASEKNHAENLMIVDLMRNDLARVSAPGSVHVLEQSALYSYATIHHLVSTVRATKHADANVYDVVRACFPPGSMTGAPKIAAMRWCAAQEKLARGVYSGTIGWFGAGGSCDLSVVIRTLLIDGNRFEFQVGGGIVADSTPEDEWRETLIKARGILAALGIDEADIAAL